jgi:FtsZ-interacting cell division protein YlmF
LQRDKGHEAAAKTRKKTKMMSVHDEEEEEEEEGRAGRSSMNACAAAAATQQNQHPRNREKRKRRKKGTRSLTFLLVIHFSPVSSSHGFLFSNSHRSVAWRSSITGLIAKFGYFSDMLELMV